MTMLLFIAVLAMILWIIGPVGTAAAVVLGGLVLWFYVWATEWVVKR